MRPRRVRRRKFEAAHQLGREVGGSSTAHVIQSGNIQDQLAAVDVADVSAVRVFWKHFYSVAAVAIVDFVAFGQTVRQAHVTLLCAGEPPTRNLAGLSRVAYIYNDVELIVFRISWTRVFCAGGQMRELPVHKPDVVSARRAWPGSVVERERKILQLPR